MEFTENKFIPDLFEIEELRSKELIPRVED